mgnify:CR=1 FL=1
MKRKITRNLWAILLIMVLAFGCNRSQRQEESAEDKSEVKFRDLMAKVDQFMLQTNINAAIELLNASLNDPDLSAQHGWLFTMLLDMQIRNGDVQSAEKLYYDSLENPELVRAGFEVFYNYYVSSTNKEETLAWIEKQLVLKIPAELHERVFALKVGIIREIKGVEGLIPLVSDCAARFNDAVSARILSDMINSFIAPGKIEEAQTLLTELRKQGKKDGPLFYLDVKFSARINLKKDAWNDVRQNMKQAIASIPDGELAGFVNEILTAARWKKALDEADKLAGDIMEGTKQKKETYKQAVYQWVEISKDRNDPEELTRRIESLMSAGNESSLMFFVVDRHFYWLIQNGDSAKKIIEIAEKLAPMLAEERDRTALKSMILDASFMSEDYEKSLKLMEEGIPERSKEWHEMAINKVKAHIALRDGRDEEAVERFRSFMKSVEKWERPEQDPATGMLHTKEMTLGHNAKRIGDIWKAKKEEQKAKEAYEEAKRYFEIALKDPQIGKMEREYIEKEMKQLPNK